MPAPRLVRATPDDWEKYRQLWLRMFRHRPDEFPPPRGEDPEEWTREDWQRRMSGANGEGITLAVESADGCWQAMATAFIEEDLGQRIAYLRESYIDRIDDDSEWLSLSGPLVEGMVRWASSERIGRAYTDILSDRHRVIRFLEATGARRTGVERASGAAGGLPAIEFVWDITELAGEGLSGAEETQG
ncbi:hypothetical protein SAMN05421595_0307 [Austwickia chelonae]|uniref:N-acetyltransferase domain-containing protein n=1 Tax=Austwickia chelonae NBRC 105200 TaxID=1184607 RepID=K6V6D2_9MICO|nr:hypothetical protein [Austwickia chelonae]GAB77798.1 hypothetical protein AUCHE_08_00390 [Austwickia chelonae NBRC 105200]SEV89715.1 hypothetical protein SAMN05421595_0307 [Austwickia chelonae]